MFKLFFLKMLAIVQTMMIAVFAPLAGTAPSPTPSLEAAVSPSPTPTNEISVVATSPTQSPIPTPKSPIEDAIDQLQELKKQIEEYTPAPTPTPQVAAVSPTPTPSVTSIEPAAAIPTATSEPQKPQIYIEPQGFSGDDYIVYAYANVPLSQFTIRIGRWDDGHGWVPDIEYIGVSMQYSGPNKNIQKSEGYPQWYTVRILNAQSQIKGTTIFITAGDENGQSVTWKNSVILN